MHGIQHCESVTELTQMVLEGYVDQMILFSTPLSRGNDDDGDNDSDNYINSYEGIIQFYFLVRYLDTVEYLTIYHCQGRLFSFHTVLVDYSVICYCRNKFDHI